MGLSVVLLLKWIANNLFDHDVDMTTCADHSGFVVAIEWDNEKEQVYSKNCYLGLLEEGGGDVDTKGFFKVLP